MTHLHGHPIALLGAAGTALVADVIPPELLGPYGLVVGLVLAVAFLGRIAMRYLADVQTQRDTALAGWTAQTAATKSVADSVTELSRGVGDLAGIVGQVLDRLATIEPDLPPRRTRR